MIGNVLGRRYQIDAVAGVGGRVVVYRARDLLLGRDVAVTTLLDPSLGPDERTRLLTEAQAAAKLNHLNIVSVYDAGMDEEVAFVVMEWVELGTDLVRTPPATIASALAISRQVCAALEYAHAIGVVHHDLKPDNVLLTEAGLVKLVDFSLTRRFSLQPDLAGGVPRSALYQAPEVALGQEAGPPADLYALGAILYEWVTGQPPFSASELATLVAQHVHMPVVPPRARNPRVPAPLDQLIVRLLSKMPGDRPSAAEALVALQALDPAAVDKARLQHELQTAREVQAGLLPRETPHIPSWQFAAYWRPAREVAGDYYDFIPLDGGRLAVVIADVSDKGMAAALFMALTRSVVRASTAQVERPEEGIALANRLLCADAQGGMFVTLFYGLLQPTTGAFAYVNAGHNPPLWYRADKDDLLPLTRTGMALGVLPDAPFDQHEVSLGRGDWVLLYTDGLTDVCDAAGSRFGSERVHRVLLLHRHASAAEMVAALESAVVAFAADAPAFDDIALLLLKNQDTQSGEKAYR